MFYCGLRRIPSMDATLGGITQVFKEVNPDSRRRGIHFSFSTVSADDSHNRYYLSGIGKAENGQRRADDQIQLANKRFRAGDYLDVAIIHRRPEPPAQNQRHDGGLVPSAPRNEHRDRPY